MVDLDKVIDELVSDLSDRKRLVPDRELLLRFFFLFSRFEYSLKRAGYLKSAYGNRAAPDWDKYAKSLPCFDTVQDPGFKAAVAYLLEKPPMSQIVSKAKELDWEKTKQRNGEDDECDKCYVLRLVRTVRNNLFHGGKFPASVGPVNDVARNKDLLEAAMTVLMQCLELEQSDQVRAAFEETA